MSYYLGCRVVESKPRPMVGCAENTAKKACNGDQGGCTWISGYPPLAFSEDSDYQLLDAEESFFAVNGSVVEMINNMDSNMMMIFGVMFVAVLIYAFRQYSSSKKEKKLVVDKAYGSMVEAN